jgi:Polyketide cyclase / dehydrase and lipid transport
LQVPSGSVADWRQNLLWEQELLAYTPVRDEPFGAGTRLHWERQLGKRRISGELVVTSFVPGRLLVTEVPTGPVQFRSVIRLAPTPDGSRTATHVELTQRPRGLLRLLAVPMARALRKRATGNMQALKELVERKPKPARREQLDPHPIQFGTTHDRPIRGLRALGHKPLRQYR